MVEGGAAVRCAIAGGQTQMRNIFDGVAGVNTVEGSAVMVPELRPESVPPAATRAALTRRPTVRMMEMMTFSVFILDSPQSPAIDVAIYTASSMVPLYARNAQRTGDARSRRCENARGAQKQGSRCAKSRTDGRLNPAIGQRAA